MTSFAEERGFQPAIYGAVAAGDAVGLAGGEERGGSDLSRNTSRRIRAGPVISAEAKV
jgi:hypothetical protein